MIKVTQNLVDASKYSLKCPHSMTPEAITVHNTANDASATNEISYMRSNSNETSFHYAVDDIQAIQGIPENRNAWHAGDGGTGFGNRKTIGIEICYSKSGGDRFIRAEQNAVELIVDILKRYNWGIDKVGTHQMRSGKYCPHRTLDMGWGRFIDMIKNKMEVKVPEAIKFDKPRKYICNLDKTQMWDLTTSPNWKSAKEFTKGTVIDVYGYIPFNNSIYLVTEYSFNKGIKNGFNQVDMKEDTSEADAIAAARILAEKKVQEAEAKRLAEAEAKRLATEAAAAKKAAEDAAKLKLETEQKSDHSFIQILKQLWNTILAFMQGKGKQ